MAYKLQIMKHMKKQENVTHSQKRKHSIEADPEMT